MNLSIKSFKKDAEKYLETYNHGLKETNLLGTILSDIDNIANKHGLILEYGEVEHVDYKSTSKKIYRIADITDKDVGGLSLNVYRNEYGTYEYNAYVSLSNDKKLKIKH